MKFQAAGRKGVLMKQNFRLTKYTCYLFYILQGTLVNLAPVLFIPLMEQYGLSYVQLGALASVNFATQLTVDIVLSKMVDKHGYRLALQFSAVMAFIGYAVFAWAPDSFGNPYLWLVIGTVLFSVGGGFLEITISPLIHALPDKAKGKNMAILHSFYAWGQVLTVVLTTLLLALVGRHHWKYIVTGWMAVPVIGFLLACAMPVPASQTEDHGNTSFRIFRNPKFLLFIFMIFFGACSETIMTQWSSAFLEKAVGLEKVVGDVAGMSMFALMLGLCRVLCAALDRKIRLHNFMLLGALGAILCYLIVSVANVPALSLVFCALTGFATGMLWPGTLVFAAEYFPQAGAWLFAYLAIAGDLGGVFGPWLTGIISDRAGLKTGMGVSAVFPLLAFLCILIYVRSCKSIKRSRI